MNTAERREIYYWAMTPDAPLCANCKYFYPHYLPDGAYEFRPANCGHCVHPRMKLRRAYDTCGYFERREETGQQ